MAAGRVAGAAGAALAAGVGGTSVLGFVACRAVVVGEVLARRAR